MNKLFLYTLIFMSLLLSSCKTMDPNNMKPLETVNFVDINRCIGEWYEIARYEHRFQKGCVGSKATYSLRDDGKITVLNECFEKSFSENIRSAKGKAWVVDKQSNAKLKVSFFWPFSGDYYIISLDENYNYALVGDPSRKYLWVLARSKSLNDRVYAELLEIARNHGFEIDNLIRVNQECN